VIRINIKAIRSEKAKQRHVSTQHTFDRENRRAPILPTSGSFAASGFSPSIAQRRTGAFAVEHSYRLKEVGIYVFKNHRAAESSVSLVAIDGQAGVVTSPMPARLYLHQIFFDLQVVDDKSAAPAYSAHEERCNSSLL